MRFAGRRTSELFVAHRTLDTQLHFFSLLSSSSSSMSLEISRSPVYSFCCVLLRHGYCIHRVLALLSLLLCCLFVCMPEQLLGKTALLFVQGGGAPKQKIEQNN
jgi:hypothetical protein